MVFYGIALMEIQSISARFAQSALPKARRIK